MDFNSFGGEDEGPNFADNVPSPKEPLRKSPKGTNEDKATNMNMIFSTINAVGNSPTTDKKNDMFAAGTITGNPNLMFAAEVDSEDSGQAPAEPKAPEDFIYVEEFYDASEKYGTGYILSNGNIGIVFKDLTKIILIKNSYTFFYFERNNTTDAGTKYFTNEPCPKEISTKVLILKKLASYFINKRYDSNTFIYIPQKNIFSRVNFVKKVLKEKYGIFFLFYSKDIQVIFHDQSTIIFYFDEKNLKYINPEQKIDKMEILIKGQMKYSDEGLQKRVNYAKKILKKNM